MSKQVEGISNQISQILSLKKKNYDLLPSTPLSVVGIGPHNMRGIKAGDECIGCGICKRICPMNNIEIEDKKAIIGDRCITCLACFHWCIKHAIYMSKETEIAHRFQYHHPKVTQKDMLNQKTER